VVTTPVKYFVTYKKAGSELAKEWKMNKWLLR
jgi:hypothetical protein